jgi:putative MATE family efflux protein
MEQKRRQDILTGGLYKLIIKLSLPLMLSNLIQTVYSLTDTYFVSMIGDEPVAAVGFVWPMIFMYMALGLGVSLGARGIISQRIGSGDNDGAAQASGQTISFMVIVSLVLSVLGIIFVPYILKLMGGTGTILTDGTSYSRIIIMGMPLMYTFFAYQTITQSEGNMMTPMYVLIFSIVLNIILDPIFILVLGWGVNGAALATTISRFAALGPVIYIIFKNKNSCFSRSLKYLKMHKETIVEILRIGMPSGVGRVTSAIGFMVMNGFIISYGTYVMTAFVIGNRITSLVMMPVMGIGSAITTIIGQNIGAQNIERAKSALKKTLVVAIGFSVIGVTILFFLKTQFIGLFTSTPEVIKSAINYTNVVMLSLPLMAVFQSLSGFFIGTKHTMMSMTGDLVRLWGIRIPLILLFKFVFHMDEYAIWWPMLLSNFLADSLFLIMYASKRWQRPVIK